MITKELIYELPDVLSEPKVISNFFTPEMFERVKKTVDNINFTTA